MSKPDAGRQVIFTYLKYIPHREDVTPNCLLIKHLHLSGSKYISRCLNMRLALVYMHFEVNFHILKPFGFSNKWRRGNGAIIFGPLYLLSTLVERVIHK